MAIQCPLKTMTKIPILRKKKIGTNACHCFSDTTLYRQTASLHGESRAQERWKVWSTDRAFTSELLISNINELVRLL